MASGMVAELRRWLAAGTPTVRVRVERALGSTPREAGAAMLVTAGEVCGTIGGGRLEFDAVAAARAILAQGETSRHWAVPLGPAIGQCCGGHVWLQAVRADAGLLQEMLAAEQAERPLVLLFGAGHVGRALARALAPLPFRVRWIDERPDQFDVPPGAEGVEIVASSAWEQEIASAPAGSACIVLTHSHSLDSLITATALERGDFSYVGLIGSRTKRRRFEHAFREMGLSEACIRPLVCPIGARGVRDKRPEIIAALTAAEIIEVFSEQSAKHPARDPGRTEELGNEHRIQGRVRRSA